MPMAMTSSSNSPAIFTTWLFGPAVPISCIRSSWATKGSFSNGHPYPASPCRDPQHHRQCQITACTPHLHPRAPHKSPPQSCTMLSLLAQRMVPPGQAHGLSSLGHAGFRRHLCTSVCGRSRGRAEYSSGRPLATAVYVRAPQVG